MSQRGWEATGTRCSDMSDCQHECDTELIHLVTSGVAFH